MDASRSVVFVASKTFETRAFGQSSAARCSRRPGRRPWAAAPCPRPWPRPRRARAATAAPPPWAWARGAAANWRLAHGDRVAAEAALVDVHVVQHGDGVGGDVAVALGLEDHERVALGHAARVSVNLDFFYLAGLLADVLDLDVADARRQALDVDGGGFEAVVHGCSARWLCRCAAHTPAASMAAATGALCSKLRERPSKLAKSRGARFWPRNPFCFVPFAKPRRTSSNPKTTGLQLDAYTCVASK